MFESGETMTIRKAKEQDLSVIMDIFHQAKLFMRENGNQNQWSDQYPSRELVLKDISNKNCYVVEECGQVHGVFSYIEGEDPTYRTIYEGTWNYQGSYGTIHRIASDGILSGITAYCFDFCLQSLPYLRIDTHRDNIPMQVALERYGFAKCGQIYISDGSERTAYDYMKKILK